MPGRAVSAEPRHTGRAMSVALPPGARIPGLQAARIDRHVCEAGRVHYYAPVVRSQSFEHRDQPHVEQKGDETCSDQLS